MNALNNIELDCGGDPVVSMFAIYFDYPSSNPADVYCFFCKIVWKDSKQKEASVGPYLKTIMVDTLWQKARAFYKVTNCIACQSNVCVFSLTLT